MYYAIKRNARLHENNHKDRESTLIILIGEVIFATWDRVGDSAKNGNLHAGWASTHTDTHTYIFGKMVLDVFYCMPPTKKVQVHIFYYISSFLIKRKKRKKSEDVVVLSM